MSAFLSLTELKSLPYEERADYAADALREGLLPPRDKRLDAAHIEISKKRWLKTRALAAVTDCDIVDGNPVLQFEENISGALQKMAYQDYKTKLMKQRRRLMRHFRLSIGALDRKPLSDVSYDEVKSSIRAALANPRATPIDLTDRYSNIILDGDKDAKLKDPAKMTPIWNLLWQEPSLASFATVPVLGAMMQQVLKTNGRACAALILSLPTLHARLRAEGGFVASAATPEEVEHVLHRFDQSNTARTPVSEAARISLRQIEENRAANDEVIRNRHVMDADTLWHAVVTPIFDKPAVQRPLARHRLPAPTEPPVK